MNGLLWFYGISQKRASSEINYYPIDNVELSGVQPVYICKNYFKSQSDKQSKYFLSKVAEGLAIMNRKKVVSEVNAHIVWEGKVTNMVLDGSFTFKKCKSEDPNLVTGPDTVCETTDVTFTDVYVVKLLNSENNEYDYPLIKFTSEVDGFTMQVKGKNNLDYQRIGINELTNYLHIGDSVRIEQFLKRDESLNVSDEYKITVL